jgi:hypothetical protein
LNRNAQELSARRQQAFARASELTAERMADGYEEIYRSLLAGRTSVRSLSEIQQGFAAHAA